MMQTPPPVVQPRVPPRFLPTLTEVVQTPLGVMQPIGAAINPDVMVQSVLQRLDGRLKASIQAAIEDMVRDQVQVLEPLLLQEIELAVRQAVQESISQKLPTTAFSNDFSPAP